MLCGVSPWRGWHHSNRHSTPFPPLPQKLINCNWTGLIAGKPTIVVPFFGDQPFWGKCVNRSGCGPEPIPIKDLNVDNLTAALEFCKSEHVAANAVKMGTPLPLPSYSNMPHTLSQIRQINLGRGWDWGCFEIPL